MSGTDKRGEGDRSRQADWIEDEGEMPDKAPLASPLGAYRSPLDEAAAPSAPVDADDPSPPPFDPEGPGTMGDAPMARVLAEIRMDIQGEVDRIEDELRVHLGKKIDKASVETMEQIAAHTAALNRLTASAGTEARAKELKVLAEKSTEGIEQRLMAVVQKLEMASRDAIDVVGVLDNQFKHARDIQKDAARMRDQVTAPPRTDWRSMAVCAAVSLMLGGLLSYSVFSPEATWKEAILFSSAPDELCEDMGFQVLNQSPTEDVCAIAYPRF